jgi:hypothetical protein
MIWQHKIFRDDDGIFLLCTIYTKVYIDILPKPTI